jgi:hypothetical protein
VPDLQIIDFVGAPGKIRTCGLRIRSPLLYPAELQARGFHYNGFFAFFSILSGESINILKKIFHIGE